MKRLLALLLLCGSAHGQITNITVVADSSRVIRTNFTLGRAQVSDLSGASFAISNITGLQTALDGKLATNGSASSLTNFPSSLLRTNGDGSGLTNLPNANLSNATGVLPIANGGTGQTNNALAIQALLPAYTNNADKILALNSNATSLVWTTNAGGGGSGSVTNVNASGGSTGLTFSGGPITNGGTLTLGGILNLASGGTGATNASGARTVLQLGTAATNDATAFQPASTNLNTLASNNAINLTNFPTGLATYPSFSNNAGKVLAVATGATSVEWIAVSNTVTDASSLTNYPGYLLQTNSADGSFPSFLLRTNGSAAALTSFPVNLLTTNGSAAGLTNFPTLNQNTTGTASNVTGVVQITNGGTGTNTASGARINLLPSYTGNSNKVLALNSNATDVEWITQSGGGGGTVDLSTTNATGVLPIAKGGTGATNAASAITNLGAVSTNSVSVSSGTVLVDSSKVGLGTFVFATGAANAVAIGRSATANSDPSTAVGRSSLANGPGSVAIGDYAQANAWPSASIQIGGGNNTNDNTIQVFNFGSVNSNRWSAVANAGTIGTNVLRSTNAAGAQAAIFPNVTTNAPTNTNAPNPTAWLDVTVGTNNYKVPLWQ